MIPLVYENWLYLVLPQKLIFQPIPLWQDLTLLFEIYLVLTTLLLCMGKASAHFFETISPPSPPVSPSTCKMGTYMFICFKASICTFSAYT